MHVQFDDEKSRLPRTLKPTGFYGFFLRLGIAKNQTQANLLLGAIFIVCIVAIFSLRGAAGITEPEAAPVIPEDSQRAGNPSEIDNSL